MSEFAIKIENLSKRYRIGLKEEIHDTMAGAFTQFIRQPIKNLRSIKRLSHFEENDSEDVIWALKDVSFEVEHGEVVGIIGKNGAGKSTLLKILSRITHPTSGRVELDGRVSSLLEVGTGFHPELTGRENIFLNGTILGMPKREIDRKFDEIVRFSGIEKFIDTPVKRYSSGMRVRLAFSVAAHLEPEILLVDEVLAVGDAEFQNKCLGKMEEVAKGGRTVLFVSHNMEAIMNLCPRTIWLENSDIVQDGDSHPIVSRYLSKDNKKISNKYTNMNNGYGEISDNAILLEAEILNADGRNCEYLKFGEPFSIHMVWKHEEPIPAVAYAIRLYDDRDRFLFGVNTLNTNISISEKGIYNIICNIDSNVLVPGNYYLSIGAYIRPHTSIHVKEHCLTASIINVPFYGDHNFNIVGNPVIALKPRWEFS